MRRHFHQWRRLSSPFIYRRNTTWRSAKPVATTKFVVAVCPVLSSNCREATTVVVLFPSFDRGALGRLLHFRVRQASEPPSQLHCPSLVRWSCLTAALSASPPLHIWLNCACCLLHLHVFALSCRQHAYAQRLILCPIPAEN